jgi:DNA-binding CsgD family transcriptional regulator
LFYVEHANLSQNGHETLLACSEMKYQTTFPIQLSPRQKQCLQMIAKGSTTASIAVNLNISERMVGYHLSAAREKLGALSTAQAVHLASKLGWLDP